LVPPRSVQLREACGQGIQLGSQRINSQGVQAIRAEQLPGVDLFETCGRDACCAATFAESNPRLCGIVLGRGRVRESGRWVYG